MAEINDLSKRLRMLRILTGFNRKEFCQRHSINENTLTSLELGRLKASENKIDELIKAYVMEGISFAEEWVLTGKGEIPKKVSESENTVYFQETSGIIGEADIFKRRNADSIVQIIQDDSMLPFYEKGDYVGGIIATEIESLLSQKCLVEVKKEVFIPRILRKVDNFFLLCASNEKAKSEQFSIKKEISRAAKIVWHRKPF